MQVALVFTNIMIFIVGLLFCLHLHPRFPYLICLNKLDTLAYNWETDHNDLLSSDMVSRREQITQSKELAARTSAA